MQSSKIHFQAINHAGGTFTNQRTRGKRLEPRSGHSPVGTANRSVLPLQYIFCAHRLWEFYDESIISGVPMLYLRK
ncbi:hypothetical protein C0674_02055 [Sporolactobacillus terrae]|uniref:Uncharacterized protein n=1 Tax=Sporolactobacillus terrae TaxID=269673 RepID=A0ABX5Q4D5_9BACL|nr:hypothetical protein C0674_02055 [Sporolactobacillus terrae]QAA24475.1 hypothetical protein C0679_02035 [Sporolactobacillus terrae]